MKAIIHYTTADKTFELSFNGPTDAIPDIPKLLDWLFRQLNRVDGGELCCILPMLVPSMSVGDFVELHGDSPEFGETRYYVCEPYGWSRSSKAKLFANLPPPALMKARSIDLTVEECRQMIKRYHEAYPTLSDWMVALGRSPMHSNEEHTHGGN